MSGFLVALLQRHRALAIFGALMWLAMVPTLLAWGLDDRALRGVSVWSKPLKFMFSVGLFSLCSAWFVGLLPEARRRDLPVTLAAATLIGAGLFEVVYITLMAALGQASHFNYDRPLFVMMYLLMGVGALSMTATQLVFAAPIVRHAAPGLLRDGVVAGLLFTFLLGTAAGAPLSAMRPPEGAGPLWGWHLSGDLRPAHFLGMHAQQLLPLAAMAVARLGGGRVALAGFALVYAVVWAAAMAAGLDGAALTPPPMAGG
jgi:hypothetical protein